MSSISSSVDISSILQALTGSSGTGLNVSALVSAAASAARAPETGWKSAQTTLSNENILLSQCNTLSSTLYDDIRKLADFDGVLTSLSATTSDSSVATASVGSGAVAGSHIIKVTQLAQTSSMYLDQTFASSTAILPTGSFTVHGAGGAIAVTIGSGVNTLGEVANYINQQNKELNVGVTASVVTDATGARLALVSTASGVANQVTIDSVSTIPDGSGGTVPFLTFSQGTEAKDATAVIDGVPVTSSSNMVTGALAGVTLNLNKEGQATVTVGTSTSSIASAVNTFVSDYNTLISGINGQFTYDASSGSSGTLSTNAAVRALQSDLLNAMTYSTSDSNAGDIRTLRSLGITMNDDGTLTVDSSQLNNALKNDPSAVQNFFQGSSSNGFANKFADTLDMYTDSTQGAFTVDIKTNKSQIDELQGRIDDLETYVANQQAVWTTKYSQAAAALMSLPSQLKQLDAMLGNDSND